jgi:hypothetical protein
MKINKLIISLACGTIAYNTLNYFIYDFNIDLKLTKKFFIMNSAIYITYVTYHISNYIN